MTKTWLRWLLVISFVCGQVHAGPIFLREWLSRFSRQAVNEEDRLTAAQALAQLDAGEWEKARLAAEQLSVHAASSGAGVQALGPLEKNAELRRAAKMTVFSAKTLPDGDALNALAQVKPVQLGVFRDLEDVVQPFHWISYVPSPVKSFNLAEERGMKDPNLGFRMAPAEFQPTIKDWNNHAISDRIAVIGTGRDNSRISEFADTARREGKAVFFYNDCEVVTGRNCPGETVGSFMKTAGTVLLYDSPNVANSLFTLSEAAMVRPLRAGQVRMLMISPSDLQQAARIYVSGAVVMIFEDDSN